MRTLDHAVDIDCPVRDVWDAWTRFERFPRFVESVRDLLPLDASRPYWQVDLLGEGEEREPAVTERVYGRKICWTTLRGLPNAGVVTFVRLGAERTRLMLRLEYSPEWFEDRSAGAMNLFEHRVRTDLERFRSLVEQEGSDEIPGDSS